MGTPDEHTFRVPLAGKAAGTAGRPAKPVRRLSVRSYMPPEPCPEHPGGKVTREGRYKAGGHTRQRYVCTPPCWYDGAKRADDPEHARHLFTPVLPRAQVEGADACPHCADDIELIRACFAAVRYHLIAVFLSRDNELDEERAEAFIPYHDPARPRGRGPPATCWFGQLIRTGDFDAAWYGAQLAAQAGAQSRRSGRELTLLAQAWNAGSRNAKLAAQYSKRLLVTAPGDVTRSHLDAALDVCNEVIATQGGATGKVWDRLRERREQIIVRQYAKPKTPPATTRNKRPARVNRYAVPAEPVAPAAPEAAARRKVKSSQATKAPRPSGR
jgi:hypothetical protein